MYWLVYAYLPNYLWLKKGLIFNQPWITFIYLIQSENCSMADVYYWPESGGCIILLWFLDINYKNS